MQPVRIAVSPAPPASQHSLMKNVRKDDAPPVQPELAAILPMVRIGWLAVVLLTGCFLPSLRAADPYAEALDKRFSSLDSAVARQVREMAQAREAEETPPARNTALLWEVVGVVAALIALRITLHIVGRANGPKTVVRRATPEFAELPSAGSSSTGAHENVASEQVESYSPDSGQPPSGIQAERPVSPSAKFFKSVSMELADQQRLLLEGARSNDPGARQAVFLEIAERLRYLCYSSRQPELRPILQIAARLEELLKKLASSGSMVTTSELRTAAGGLEVIHDFYAVADNFRLPTDDTGRILVVDDDAITRFAISAALKEVVTKPDLASDGERGLSLANRETYDAIFLDVEMPGMNGFELCQKIHATELNPTTAVVFVTQHSDFETRSKAAELGGHDLIGKPFLALEITVKALTLILRARLRRHEHSIECTEKNVDKFQPKPSDSNESPSVPSEAPLVRNPIGGGYQPPPARPQ